MKSKANHIFDPARQMILMAQMARIGFESQMIIGLRLAGMMGLAPQAPGENLRMITEKQEAAVESVQAIIKASARGASPDQVMSAALRPYGRRTRANSKRLSGGKK